MNRMLWVAALFILATHLGRPLSAAPFELHSHVSQTAMVPQPDRTPAPAELLNEGERDEQRLRYEREFAEAKRTVIIENRLGTPFRYGVIASSGSQVPLPHVLKVDRAHRFTAPADKPHPRLANLSPSGANGSIWFTYEQANVEGCIVLKLQANKRYAAIQNANGFIEIVQVDVIKQISRDEITVRVPDVRSLTEPGMEAKRVNTLDANLCREPTGRYTRP